MPHRLALLACPALLLLLPSLAAQCAHPVTGSPQPDLSGEGLRTALWDPDGAGPLPLGLVVVGSRLLGGSGPLVGAGIVVAGVAVDERAVLWDGTTWKALGAVFAFPVVTTAVSVWNSELILAVDDFPFGVAGAWHRVGDSWFFLGGPDHIVDLDTWNGSLVALGHTDSFVDTPLIQIWNGAGWTALPPPPTLRTPTDMIVFEGELIVVGSGPASAPGVLERWNGTSWAPSIVAQGRIDALSVRPTPSVGGSDTLFAAGEFTSIGGAPIAYLAKTAGAPAFSWSDVGGGISAPCTRTHVRNFGLGDFWLMALTTSATTPVMRYRGSTNTWTAIGTEPFADVTFYAGSHHAVKTSSIDDPACQRFDGANWVPVRGPGMLGSVHAATESGSDMIVGGDFTTISGVAMNHVARWDGDTFTPLGPGLSGASVEALLTLDNGDIVAGGDFTAAGGTPLHHIARWNGTTWLPMGNGFDQPVYALCKMPNGDVIAGGAFTQEIGAPNLSNHVARWNGSAWLPMDTGMNDDVLALVVRGDGTLFAGGRFTIASLFSRYYVAQWTGSVWGQVGAGMDAAVLDLAARPNGDIVAVGEFTQASLQPVSHCALWNGAAWSDIGLANSAPVHAVAALPNGDVISVRGSGIVRWSGNNFWTLTTRLGRISAATPTALVLKPRADGALFIGGNFRTAGDVMAYSLASVDTACPATSSPYGTGCSSAAGPLEITADTLPWIGATLRTTTTGVAANSLCLGLIGLSQLSIPLSALLPEGQPGCTLLVSPDDLRVLTPGPGTVSSSFAIANQPSLIGLPLFAQTIPLEFDLSGAITAVRASNALALVIGAL